MKNLISQWQVIRKDKWVLSCLTWIPILLAILIWAVFYQGIARDIPIGVVDLQHSQLSRQLIQDYDASPSLAIKQQYSDVLSAKQALKDRDIYGYLVIPHNFDKGVYLQMPPQVSMFYNSQYILVGRLINGASLQVQGTFNAKVSVIRNLSHGDVTVKQALGQAVTLQTQITPLFNTNTNYAQFLVSAVIPALWQIMIVVTTILILAANNRQKGLQAWLGKRPINALYRTLLPYLPIFSLFGFGFLYWFYIGLEWPMHGHWLVLIIAQLLTSIACMIMGAFFFFLSLDPARAMSFAGAFTAPSFAFMGITFPTSDMSNVALVWRSLLPISHYIEIQVNQVSYSASSFESLSQFWPFIGYLLPLLLVFKLIQIHLKKTLVSV